MKYLSHHILDIANNSIRANSRLISILVDEQPDIDRLTIEISDDGEGLSNRALELITDTFYTTCKSRKVGLGIPLLKQKAELCGGSFSIKSEPGLGTTVRAIFPYNSIDRQPLGNLPEIVSILIAGAPSIDILFTHKIGEAFTAFDTRKTEA